MFDCHMLLLPLSLRVFLSEWPPWPQPERPSDLWPGEQPTTLWARRVRGACGRAAQSTSSCCGRAGLRWLGPSLPPPLPTLAFSVHLAGHWVPGLRVMARPQPRMSAFMQPAAWPRPSPWWRRARAVLSSEVPSVFSCACVRAGCVGWGCTACPGLPCAPEAKVEVRSGGWGALLMSEGHRACWLPAHNGSGSSAVLRARPGGRAGSSWCPPGGRCSGVWRPAACSLVLLWLQTRGGDSLGNA